MQFAFVSQQAADADVLRCFVLFWLILFYFIYVSFCWDVKYRDSSSKRFNSGFSFLKYN